MAEERYFSNRSEAGKQLALYLSRFKEESVHVFALPKGGVPVAYEVAEVLHCPLDVFIARKIGSPFDPEFGIGAVAEGDVLILNNEVIEQLNIDQDAIDIVVSNQLKEIERQINLYRKGKTLPDIKGKTVILIDDGVATGLTAQAALTSLDNMEPEKLIFASPVCSYYSSEGLSEFADELYFVLKPFDLTAVGVYYENFDQVTDDEVIKLLKLAQIT